MEQEIQNSKQLVDLKVFLASFKSELNNLSLRVEKISDAINKLNEEIAEHRTKIQYSLDDIHELKQFIERTKIINESIVLLKEAFNKLDASFSQHSEISNHNFSNIMNDINNVKAQIDSLPLLYIRKTNRGFFDYVKLAPAIIVILSTVITIFVIYLKGVL